MGINDKNIGLPVSVKEKYDNVYKSLEKPKVSFTIVFESILDYEIEQMVVDNYADKFFFELKKNYETQYAYDVDKDIKQTVIGVSLSAYEKYGKLLSVCYGILKGYRGVSYSLLDTIVEMLGDNIAKNERFNEILENNFKAYYDFVA